MDHADPHCMIVGASSGVGRALAIRLKDSHRLSVLARRTERLNEIGGDHTRAFACDVTQPADIEAAVKASIEAHGPVSALVYCAGLQKIRPLRGQSASDIDAIYRTNLIAPTLFATHFASQRVSTERAVFCIISSIAGQRPEPAIVPYSASKAGVDALIKGMAKELGPRRAVAIAPGWLETEMTLAFPRIYDSGFKEKLEKASPAGIATVDAVVEMVAFLISDQARFVSGEVVRVDGGAAL